jgi:hypothetical protein
VIGLKGKVLRENTPEATRHALRRAIKRDQPVIVSCLIPYSGRPARHYAVVVGIDKKCLYFADPFPHKDTRENAIRVLPWETFKSLRWLKGATVWGPNRWAVELSRN